MSAEARFWTLLVVAFVAVQVWKSNVMADIEDDED